MFCSIIFYSKSRKSLSDFIRVFKTLLKIENKFINCLQLKQLTVKTKHKKIVLLKSTHVHKRALKKYRSTTYSRKIQFYCVNSKLLLFIFKKLKEKSFSDVNYKVKTDTISKKFYKYNLHLNSTNLKFLPQLNYLRLIDLFGENIFRKSVK